MNRTGTRAQALRRMVAVASAAVALLAMVAQPALAAYGYLNMQRAYTMSGARNHLTQNLRVNDSAAGLSVGTNIIWGPLEGGHSFGLNLEQGTTRAASRGLDGDGWGQFRNVASPNNICTFEAMTDDGFGVMSCENAAFDWVLGTTYRIIVKRGDLLSTPIAKNANGHYWLVQISRFNATTKKWEGTQKVVSFRLPLGLLGPEHQGPYVFANYEDCAKIDRVSATFAQPSGAKSTTTWKPVSKYNYGCPASAMRVSGSSTGPVTFVVAP